MIEQISGTGQSGIAEATATGGKQGQNSLFAKLMAMFEKQGKAGDKTSLVNGAKTPTMTLLKQTAESTLKDGQENKSAQKGVLTATAKLAQKSSPDASKVVQQGTAIIAAPAKKLAGETTETVDGSTVQAVALHALNQSHIDSKTGQPAVKIIMDGKQSATTKDGQTAGKETVQLIGKQQESVNGKIQMPHMETGTATIKRDSHVNTDGEQQVDLKAAPGDAKAASGKFEAVSAAAAVTRKQGVEQAAANTATTVREGTNGQPVAMPTVTRQERPLTADERDAVQQLTAKQGNAATGNDKNSPLAAHNHTAQQHNASTTTQSGNAPVQQAAVLETAMQSDSSGNQQSGEKGGQDGRNIQILATDNRPATSGTSANAANFQHYMNHKSVPTMTMYESIQHIAHAAKNGQTRLEIQLDPAHLGKIHISLQTDASKQLQVHLIVDQSATRAAIDQQLPALKQALAQQGLDLSGFSMGSHGEQASSGFGNNQSSPGFRQNASNAGIDLPSSTPSNRPVASHSGSGLSIHV
ncbi:hypothetical protein FEF65_00130 [Mariprofundus erugo]|uniref:Flagellar hook-length control protein-like C-terminal domain-containing protein n=1 Tax=Mariprofundus erugo TaxID=2528639 RepID=A0A5R9GSR0_9PROT|nr:flagellar hook-length control protein FliK [Mariprofundus erugo]TLS68950.1 hypothetical protein FEF65_00130 [Mariprofundus erugo]